METKCSHQGNSMRCGVWKLRWDMVCFRYQSFLTSHLVNLNFINFSSAVLNGDMVECGLKGTVSSCWIFFFNGGTTGQKGIKGFHCAIEMFPWCNNKSYMTSVTHCIILWGHVFIGCRFRDDFGFTFCFLCKTNVPSPNLLLFPKFWLSSDFQSSFLPWRDFDENKSNVLSFLFVKKNRNIIVR